ncbi:unnamed protein product [Diplocarpon coronariae]|nr:hypothetical protein JHW43_006657 [Diplocarpon mali]
MTLITLLIIILIILLILLIAVVIVIAMAIAMAITATMLRVAIADTTSPELQRNSDLSRLPPLFSFAMETQRSLGWGSSCPGSTLVMSSESSRRDRPPLSLSLPLVLSKADQQHHTIAASPYRIAC